MAAQRNPLELSPSLIERKLFPQKRSFFAVNGECRVDEIVFYCMLSEPFIHNEVGYFIFGFSLMLVTIVSVQPTNTDELASAP